jgi:hypothetical protein
MSHPNLSYALSDELSFESSSAESRQLRELPSTVRVVSATTATARRRSFTPICIDPDTPCHQSVLCVVWRTPLSGRAVTTSPEGD